MNNRPYILALSSVAIISFGAFVYSAAAYVPLAPLPGVPASGTNLTSYVGAIFKIGLGLAGVFAVLMIVIAGIEYIGGAASPSAREDANQKIWNAILGLVIALASWLLLNTINPDLQKLGFGTPVAPITAVLYCVNHDPGGQTTCFQNLSSCNVAEQNLTSAPGAIITKGCYQK